MRFVNSLDWRLASLLTLVMIGAFLSPAIAQEVEHIVLPADGAIRSTAVTDVNTRYRITVEGTYSMWPQFDDCHGVDAAYVYDVPQEELDAYHWPPTSLVPLPHWVGDPTEWSLLTIRLSFRGMKGFRIDGEPLPNTGFNVSTHRYQIEKIGTGAPITFQILDSNYSILDEKVIPRYEDNCGELQITVERITERQDINICDIDPICKDGSLIGIKLWAGIFEEDTSVIGGKQNVLKNISPQQLGIIDDGFVMCTIDSISCSAPSEPLAVGLVVDRSGSMAAPISATDQTIRIDAAKRSLKNFIDNLREEDSTFVISFNDLITTNQDWTLDKNLLKAAVDQLNPGGMTAFYDAIFAALDKIAVSSSSNRAIIFLSDGYNTAGTDWSDSMLDRVRQRNIPIYIIGLGLSDDDPDKLGRQRMESFAKASGGLFIPVNDAAKLDSIYSTLGESLYEQDCCAVYFRTSDCPPGMQKFIRIIYAPRDTLIMTKVISYTCPDCSKVTGIKPAQAIQAPQEFELDIYPVPTNRLLSLKYTLSDDSPARVELHDSSGRLIQDFTNDHGIAGTFYSQLDLGGLPNGIYLVTVTSSQKVLVRKALLVR